MFVPIGVAGHVKEALGGGTRSLHRLWPKQPVPPLLGPCSQVSRKDLAPQLSRTFHVDVVATHAVTIAQTGMLLFHRHKTKKTMTTVGLLVQAYKVEPDRHPLMVRTTTTT